MYRVEMHLSVNVIWIQSGAADEKIEKFSVVFCIHRTNVESSLLFSFFLLFAWHELIKGESECMSQLPSPHQ